LAIGEESTATTGALSAVHCRTTTISVLSAIAYAAVTITTICSNFAVVPGSSTSCTRTTTGNNHGGICSIHYKSPATATAGSIAIYRLLTNHHPNNLSGLNLELTRNNSALSTGLSIGSSASSTGSRYSIGA
jgi:hypothetical protein